MGLDVTMLDENELSSGDLTRFDTIVVGVRASQVRPDFVANNNRLLDFVREGGTLVEIPVTTMRLLKVPIHVSYLLYLSSLNRRAPTLALHYFATALRLCEATGVQPSLLLHPLDFLGGDDPCAEELSFFPAMNMPRGRKLELVGECLRMLTARFDVLTLGEHAARAALAPARAVIPDERLRAPRAHAPAPQPMASEQDG